jgi:hypothetical protein
MKLAVNGGMKNILKPMLSFTIIFLANQYGFAQGFPSLPRDPARPRPQVVRTMIYEAGGGEHEVDVMHPVEYKPWCSYRLYHYRYQTQVTQAYYASSVLVLNSSVNVIGPFRVSSQGQNYYFLQFKVPKIFEYKNSFSMEDMSTGLIEFEIKDGHFHRVPMLKLAHSRVIELNLGDSDNPYIAYLNTNHLPLDSSQLENTRISIVESCSTVDLDAPATASTPTRR